MGAGKLHTSELDHFVAKCDELGGPQHPNTQAYLSDFSLKFDTKVNENLNPFSGEYYQSQIDLYSEISNRILNQEAGEQMPLDVELYSKGVNPYNSGDINFISRNCRALSTTLYMANIPPHGKVLDMGCGWGLSSELIAFCGAQVTCVDINPLFVELNQRRSTRLDLPLRPRLSSFDEYQDTETYDLILFYECLHHAVKPWETIQHLAQFVAPRGKIALAGEAIETTFWRNWGLRLDPLSVYCIRKFGWFESGWSATFLQQCFESAGFTLHLYPQVGLYNGMVGIALRDEDSLKPEAVLNLEILPPSNLQASLNNFPLKKKAARIKALLRKAWRF